MVPEVTEAAVALLRSSLGGRYRRGRFHNAKSGATESAELVALWTFVGNFRGRAAFFASDRIAHGSRKLTGGPKGRYVTELQIRCGTPQDRIESKVGAMTDRIALVTGCSRGVGAALVETLLDRGWRVHGLSRSGAPGSALAKGLVDHKLDLSDLEAVQRRFDDTFTAELGLANAGRVALVNNAGLLAMAPTQALDLATMDAALRANVTVPAWLMGWFVKETPAATRLDLVNLSSGAASNPYPGWLSYCTSKAALRMAGRNVAADVAEQPALVGRPIHVLDYAPGVVATGMQAEIRGADPAHFPRAARFHDLHDSGALATPEAPATEIADLLDRPAPPAYEERRLGT